MSPYSNFPDHGINDPDVQDDQAHGLPSAEALLAGTLALMTGYAQGCCQGHREMMAKKIVSNLSMLTLHPAAAPAFRAMALNLHGMWSRLVQQLQQLQAPGEAAPADVPQAAARPAMADTPNPDQHRVLWHTTPETLQ